MTRFHYAAGQDSTIFKLLLEAGGNVNEVNLKSEYRTPLLWAIISGKETNAKLLIQHGVNIQTDSTDNYYSPLGKAISYLRINIVKALLDNGADVNAKFSEAYEDCMLCPEGITAMHQLVSMLRYEKKELVNELIQLVLKYEPDLNIPSAEGYTPLDYALFSGNFELVDLFMEHGAKFDLENRSPLLFASQFSNYGIVKYLLESDANPNVKAYNNDTPILLSLKCCGGVFGEGITTQDRVNTISLLLEYGADINMNNDYDESFAQLISQNEEIRDALVKTKHLK